VHQEVATHSCCCLLLLLLLLLLLPLCTRLFNTCAHALLQVVAVTVAAVAAACISTYSSCSQSSTLQLHAGLSNNPHSRSSSAAASTVSSSSSSSGGARVSWRSRCSAGRLVSHQQDVMAQVAGGAGEARW